MPKAPLGILLLHGLSSHISCIDPVVPLLEKLQLPYRMPYLRGHGSRPEDLEGVQFSDWLLDGQKALDELLEECEQVVPVALSMGALVALNIAMVSQDKIGGIVCLVPALKYKSKLATLAPVIALFQKKYQFDPKGPQFYDRERVKFNQNYEWIPTSAVVELQKMQKFTRRAGRLEQLKVPALVIQARQDLVIDPHSAEEVVARLGSRDKTLSWIEQCGHELLLDQQSDKVLQTIEGFLVRLQKQVLSSTVLSETES